MLATVRSSTLVGVNSLDIDVEVDVSPGLPTFEIVGLPGTAVREARDRVRTAIKNAGFNLPPRKVTVNLAPAHVPKSGTQLDLPIAFGILIAGGIIDPGIDLSQYIVLGELSLDGGLRPIHGALCVAANLRGRNLTLLLPEANVSEARLVPQVNVVGIRSLCDVSALATAPIRRTPSTLTLRPEGSRPEHVNLWNEIKGQDSAKRVMEIAAAGGHHALLMGPPGAGKTALAQAMASLTPALTQEEALEVSRVYSVVGLLNEETPFIQDRPFRAPHHSVTPVGLLGGGNPVRPGEVSLAHRGFLFLDELPEFAITSIEGLRQPLEAGEVILSRASGTLRFPAAFSLIAAANPCPCGYYGDPRHSCVCTDGALMRYRRRLSGPIVDRIDLLIRVHRPSVHQVLNDSHTGGDFFSAKQRVDDAWQRQRRRFHHWIQTNATMSAQDIRKYVNLDEEGDTLLREAAGRWSLSPRVIQRVLRVSRTIADLHGRTKVIGDDIAEALSYRFS